jgi:hypothetical protein
LFSSLLEVHHHFEHFLQVSSGLAAWNDPDELGDESSEETLRLIVTAGSVRHGRGSASVESAHVAVFQVRLTLGSFIVERSIREALLVSRESVKLLDAHVVQETENVIDHAQLRLLEHSAAVAVESRVCTPRNLVDATAMVSDRGASQKFSRVSGLCNFHLVGLQKGGARDDVITALFLTALLQKMTLAGDQNYHSRQQNDDHLGMHRSPRIVSDL